MSQIKILKLILGLTLIFGHFSVYSIGYEPESSTLTRKRGASALEEEASSASSSPPTEGVIEESKQAETQIEGLVLPFKRDDHESTFIYNWGVQIKDPLIEMEEGKIISLYPIIEKMVKNEAYLRARHADLETKENLAQYCFAIVNSSSDELVAFSCRPCFQPIDPREEIIGFYTNGMVAVQYPGFSHQMGTYPWISQSEQDKRLILFQRPSTRIEATEKTVSLLKKLQGFPLLPPTVYPEELNRMSENFEMFKKAQPDIKTELLKFEDELFKVLDRLYQLLNEDQPETLRYREINALINRTLKNFTYDLEGKIFEVIKNIQNEEIERKIDVIKAHRYSGILMEIENLKTQEQTQEVKKSLRQLHIELNSKEEIKLLRRCRADIGKMFDQIRKTYIDIIDRQGFKNLCTCKKFNFGCSEQLIIDHIFDADIDNTVTTVTRYLDKESKALILLIHSTMTPCKTCSLDIALELVHQDGRIRTFFNLIDEDLSNLNIRKWVFISFHRAYDSEEENKKYGFNFDQTDKMVPPVDRYFLFNFTTISQKD